MSVLPTSPSSMPLGWNALPESYRIPASAPSLAEAQAYCERLAKTHYENFSVATWFLPKRLRQHFYNVYAYCRISDDLGDEVDNPQQSLELLDQWEGQLNSCYAGSPSMSFPIYWSPSGRTRRSAVLKRLTTCWATAATRRTL